MFASASRRRCFKQLWGIAARGTILVLPCEWRENRPPKSLNSRGHRLVTFRCRSTADLKAYAKDIIERMT